MYVIPSATTQPDETPPIVLAPAPGGYIPLRRITVTSVLGHPHFYVSLSLTRENIAHVVETRHGRQPDGKPHEWRDELQSA